MTKFAEVLRRLGMSPIEARALVNLLRGRAVCSFRGLPQCLDADGHIRLSTLGRNRLGVS